MDAYPRGAGAAAGWTPRVVQDEPPPERSKRRRRPDQPPDEPLHPSGLSPSMALSACYWECLRELLLENPKLKRGTIEQYDAAVRAWARAGLAASVAIVPDEPPLKILDASHCERFVRNMLARPGLLESTLSPNTVRKAIVHLGRLLTMLAPDTVSSKAIDPYGLFGWQQVRPGRWRRRRPPRFEPPDEVERTPEPLSLEQIGRLLAACEQLRRPVIPGLPTPVFFAAYVLWSYNVGTRLDTTLALQRGWIALPWIRVPRGVMKGRRRELKLWVNRAAQAAIAPLLSADARIFAWPCGEDYLKKRFARLQDLAGIRVVGRHGVLHRCRQAMITWLMARNESVAKLQAGHSLQRNVALKHYTSPTIVKRLMERLPQPELPAWYPAPAAPPAEQDDAIGGQLRLF